MDVVMIVGPESATQNLCERLVVQGYVVCASQETACVIDALERGVRPIALVLDDSTSGAMALRTAARSLGVPVQPLSTAQSAASIARTSEYAGSERRSAFHHPS